MKFILIMSLCVLNFLSASHSQIREELDSRYINTQIINRQKIPEAHRLITKTLSPFVFPCLPDSHRWVKEGNEYVVKRSQDAKEHEIEFVVFADHPRSPSVVNYLTMIDGRNVQSYAHTRQKTFKGKRDPLEFTVSQYIPDHASLRSMTITKRFIDGHCIDHADTIHPEYVNKVHSSREPRNHLAESDWGLYVRRELVASIRSTGGSYMQMPYYPSNPVMTSLSTSVPFGVHFFTFQPYESHIYNIRWDTPVISKQGWRNFLYPNETSLQSHRYLPALYGLEGEYANNWNGYVHHLTMNSSVYQGYYYGYDLQLANNLKIFADFEMESIATKIRFLYYSCIYQAFSPDLMDWHKRALRHADLLLEFGKPAFSSVFNPEVQHIMKQTSESYYDHWHQVLSDQQDLLTGKRRSSFLKLAPNLPTNICDNAQLSDVANIQPVQNVHPYNLRSNPKMLAPTIINSKAYAVTFGTGKGSRKQVEDSPIENIQKILALGNLHLVGADKTKVDAWLKVNQTSFMQLNRSNIPVFYSPSTTSKSSHQNIEQALRRAGFTNIARR